MSDEPDLSLPPTLPEMKKYREEPMELWPFALYTLVSVSEADLKEACDIANSECEGMESVRLPPQADFTGKALRDVMNYHRALADTRTFDRNYFMVLTTTNWRVRGILLVNLDWWQCFRGREDDDTCYTDSFWVKPSDSGIILVNLQIANTDWFEVDEGYNLTTRDYSAILGQVPQTVEEEGKPPENEGK